jgi:hypothetical protein
MIPNSNFAKQISKGYRYVIFIKKMFVCYSKECHKRPLEKLPGLEASVLIHSPVEEWVEVGVSDIQQLSYNRRYQFLPSLLLFPRGIFQLQKCVFH